MTSKNLILGLAALAAVGLIAIPAQAGGKPGKVRIGFQVNVGTAPHRSGRADRGRHEWREQRVWVPGRYEVKWVERRQPDRFEWQTVSVKLPDRHEWRTERAWVPGSVTFREKRYLLRPGYWDTRFVGGHPRRIQRVWIPPQYGSRRIPVEQPGRFEERRIRVTVPGGYRQEKRQVCVPGETYRVQERVWCPAHHETKRIKVWVPGATCAPRKKLVIGGNHGGFGFSLSFSR
jgi:hypothetical protein